MKAPKPPVVLAVYPSARGMGYCVFRSPDELIDWGCSEFRMNKSKRSIKRINQLIKFYQPTQAVLEDTQVNACKRHERIKTLIKDITAHLIAVDIPVKHYSTLDVSSVIPAMNKESRAQQLAKLLPELKDSLPAKRKLWENEHRNIQMFDAVALAQTYYYLEHY